MTGTIENGKVQNGYGLRFELTRYILFRGASYNASDTTNAVVPLDSRVTFSTISFPNGSIVFASKSGEIVGYASASSSLTVSQLDSGEVKTLQLNHYGIIASIN